MKRPSAMWPQRMRLTCWQSSAGCAGSVAKARTAACRFDISSAAGMPLPTTSAIESAEARSAERDGVVAIAADAGRRLPRRRDLPAVDLRHRGRQQLALDAPRLVELALLVRVAAAAARGRLRSRRAASRRSCALSHGFCTKSRTPRRIASTARSTEPQPVMTIDRQQAVERLHAREQVDPFAARRRVAGVVQVHQQQIERAAGERGERRVRRRHRVDAMPSPFSSSRSASSRSG